MKLFRGYLYGFFIWLIFLFIEEKLFKEAFNRVYITIHFTDHSVFKLSDFIFISLLSLTVVLFIFFRFYFKEKFTVSLKRAFIFNLILIFFYFGNCMLVFMDI